MTEYCRLCGTESTYITSAMLMKKHEVKYFDCQQCGYIQTQKPFWLEEAYKLPINSSDTGILSRNYNNVWLVYSVNFILFRFKFRKITHVDYAGGYGILVKFLRDLKINSYWHDKYCENLFANEFVWNKNIDIKSVNLVSAFEVFEHFENPKNEIENLLSISNNVLFTTRLIPDSMPPIQDWWYYGVEHGQHIGFYRKKTLFYLANKYNLKVATDGTSNHLLSKNHVSSFLFKCACIFSKISFMNILKRF